MGEAETFTAADEREPALEVALLELCDDDVEVECPGDGVDGVVQVGQLVPPFLQVVAKAPELASASRAVAMRAVLFTLDPRWWWFVGTAPGGA